jgi:RNA polymerase sigma-70 factor (ECF subfamily)
MTTPEALLGLAGNRAHLAWATLVDRHGEDVWRIIISRYHDQHAAEDIFQEFWLALPKAAASFKPTTMESERSARAWLMRVAYTMTIDHLRRQRAQQGHTKEIADFTDDLASPATAHVESLSADDEPSHQHLVHQVHQAIETLPEGYRRPLLLHVVGGLSYDDVADDLRCTVNNARVRVHRGLKRVREILGLKDSDGDKENVKNNSRLAGFILPVGFIMPMTPAFPLVMSVPIPVISKAAATTSWSQSPWLAIAGATVGGAAVVAGIAQYEPPTPATPIPPSALETSNIIDDFERTSADYVGHSYNAPIPTFQLVAPPPKAASQQSLNHGSSALRISWTANNNIWVDATLSKELRQNTPRFNSLNEVTLSFSLWLPPTSYARHVGVRFADAEGEIFEFRYPIPALFPDGWHDITIPITATNGKHWRTNRQENSIVDFPYTFYGFGIALRPMTMPTQDHFLLIDNVRINLTP